MEKIILVIFFLCLSLSPAIAQEQDIGSQKSITKTLEARVGEEFTLVLESNRTTGYSWQLTEPFDEGIIRLISSEYKAPETRVIGAGNKEVWTFKAVGKGRAIIHMEYVRPWEKDTPPVRTTTIEVTVKPAK